MEQGGKWLKGNGKKKKCLGNGLETTRRLLANSTTQDKVRD